MLSSGRRESPNSVAVEELSICPAEKHNSDREGEPLAVNDHPEALRNHWPTHTHPFEPLSLSARYAKSRPKRRRPIGSGFPWKSATTEFTNPTRVINGDGVIHLLISLVYWVLRRLLELALLRQRSEHSKELEILVLRHQVHVLRRQIARPRLQPADRLLLAALSRSLPCSAWSTLFVSPATLLRWHRELVARRWTYSRRTGGRPRPDRGCG
jgi:hypothetical protein